MSKRTDAYTGALISALCLAALTGCAASAPEAAETPTVIRPSATPSEAPTVSSEPPSGAAAECKLPGGDGMILNDEPLNVELYAAMIDFGPREGANGTVTYAEDGTLASYVVASGDYRDAILERLCLGPYSYEALNAIRRGSLHSVDPTHQVYLTPLYAGDTLNLSPYTIASVGDVNGEVHSYETVFILPPQR